MKDSDTVKIYSLKILGCERLLVITNLNVNFNTAIVHVPRTTRIKVACLL